MPFLEANQTQTLRSALRHRPLGEVATPGSARCIGVLREFKVPWRPRARRPGHR